LPLPFTKVLPGSHTVTVTTPTGATASATFTVIKWGFGARSPV
jgi:hypothetical protein